MSRNALAPLLSSSRFAACRIATCGACLLEIGNGEKRSKEKEVKLERTEADVVSGSRLAQQNGLPELGCWTAVTIVSTTAA